jgi:hypothetical protein
LGVETAVSDFGTSFNAVVVDQTTADHVAAFTLSNASSQTGDTGTTVVYTHEFHNTGNDIAASCPVPFPVLELTFLQTQTSALLVDWERLRNPSRSRKQGAGK